MRILLTCVPLRGHVNTVLPLAQAGVRAGHDVVVATGPDLVGVVEQYGVAARAVGEGGPGAEARHDLSVPYFLESAGRRAADLLAVAEQLRPEMVVHEETELAGAVAAVRTGAQHAVHGLGLMPPTRVWDALAPGLAALGEQWGVSALPHAVRAATYLHVCPPSLRAAGEPLWRHLQPLRPTTGCAAPGAQLPPRLAGLPHADTVHLTLGTVFHDNEEVLLAALDGLSGLGVNVVVTTGPGTDPVRLGPQPPHVLVESYLPHADLLPHCCLVVSQGGAGAMFGALHQGLPQLVLPQGADQFMNAAALVSAGAALSLGPGEVSAATVADAARRLLTDLSFALAARRLRAEIARLPSADEVIDRLTAGARSTLQPNR